MRSINVVNDYLNFELPSMVNKMTKIFINFQQCAAQLHGLIL